MSWCTGQEDELSDLEDSSEDELSSHNGRSSEEKISKSVAGLREDPKYAGLHPRGSASLKTYYQEGKNATMKLSVLLLMKMKRRWRWIMQPFSGKGTSKDDRCVVAAL